MAYWESMSKRFGTILAAAACAAMLGCSSAPESKNPEPKKEVAKPAPTPAVFQVNLDTSKGPVVIEVHRDWAPRGADQFYTLVKAGYYDGDRFFRVLPRFVVQFGISGDPKSNQLWSNANILDDPVQEHNVKGTVTFATAGPNTRSTQLFINMRDNRSLDSQGFAPIGKVTSGMDVVERFYSSYGEMSPAGGEGPDPSKIETQGNDYLASRFPRLDYIKKATIQ
jgi:peptidyl-prolyl cis-trans isomerase A (cyclophilin A)